MKFWRWCRCNEVNSCQLQQDPLQIAAWLDELQTNGSQLDLTQLLRYQRIDPFA
ncbi:MAG: hypothetical protein U5L01_14665 [Rheinheimera sp.]|nr:hypothetical protein [Rheinheimera sp.]